MCEESSLQTNGCVSKIVSSWRTFISSLKIDHQIHPSDPVAESDCEFIVINPKIKIRVIHVTPSVNVNPYKTVQRDSSFSKRSSLSEEYWFTRNRPRQLGSCNCSFKRSLRYSVISNQPSLRNVDIKRQSVLSTDLPPTRITNVETFVERLIQETFIEAFQEYYMLKNETGKINLAYESTEDDKLDIVPLRKKLKPNSLSKEVNKVQRISIDSHRNLSCVHKEKLSNNKPLVLLLHGIGTSADIWWILISNLVKNGFEVVAPDILGHGYSSAPDKAQYYTFNNLLMQLLAVFDYYIGTSKRKVILIGHSYGCSLITALYPHRASQISQLILISGGGPTPLAPPVKNNEISSFGCIHTIFHPFLFCGLKRSFFYSSRGKHFEYHMPDSAIPKNILDHIGNGQKWPEGDAAFHRRISVPTLLVHGLQDKIVTLVQECEMERTIPRAFLELIPNAGHMPMIETPEHVTHMIMCFLETWS